MKVCSKCKQAKELACFSKSKSCKDGLHRWCKDCAKAIKKAWHAANKSDQNKKSLAYYNENKDDLKPKMVKAYYDNRDARIAYSAKYRLENKDEIRSRELKRYDDNKEKFRRKSREWARANTHKVVAATAKRRAALSNATLDLSGDQKSAIADIYWLAKDLRACTGEDYHVDHIIPLRGDGICGLHVPWNLQILPSDINQKKYNHVDYNDAFAFNFK